MSVSAKEQVGRRDRVRLRRRRRASHPSGIRDLPEGDGDTPEGVFGTGGCVGDTPEFMDDNQASMVSSPSFLLLA